MSTTPFGSPKLWELESKLDELYARLPKERPGHVAFRTWMVAAFVARKTMNLYTAAALLCRSGHGVEAWLQLRALCELYIVWQYLVAHENEIEDFIAFGPIDQWRLLEPMLGRDPAREAVARAQYLEARKRFSRVDKKGKLRVYDNWSGHSIAALAAKCTPNTKRLYDLSYRYGSHILHSGCTGLLEGASAGPDGAPQPRDAPDNCDVDGVLQHAQMVMIGLARETSHLLGVDIEAEARDLLDAVNHAYTYTSDASTP